MLQIIRSPWVDTFLSLIRDADEVLYLASPFIKKECANLIEKNLPPDIDFRYINSFKLSNFLRGASDLEALRILHDSGCSLKNVHRLHAKIFLSSKRAIVTSGNLTPGGLKNNLEYGLLIEGEIADTIRTDYLNIFNDNEYPVITPEVMKKAGEILASVPIEKMEGLTINDKDLFGDALNDENIEEKFTGGVDSILKNVAPWQRDVFMCLMEIKQDIFSLKEVYTFEERLKKLHPRNNTIRDSIRRNLQELRSIGLLEFLSPGRYKKLWR